MTSPIVSALRALSAGEALDETALDPVFAALLDGESTPAQTAGFLALSARHLADPAFLTAGARQMRARMVTISAPPGAIDLCGTGGDGAHTLNISTAASFIVAGAGTPVAKHGNRAASSRSGAADVLETLGVNVMAPLATLEACLNEAGLAFLFAQTHHPALKGLAPVRRELGVRTVFNVLGPLCNPARVRRQIVGVADPNLLDAVAGTLVRLGADKVWTLHGAGGLDEASCEGETRIVTGGAGQAETRFVLSPADAGLQERPLASLQGGLPEDNAQALRAVLSGEDRDSGYRTAALLNAACALAVARDLAVADAVNVARESLESGAANACLQRLIALTATRP